MSYLTSISADAFVFIAQYLSLSDLMYLKETGNRKLRPLLGAIQCVEIDESHESYITSTRRRDAIKASLASVTTRSCEIDFLMLGLVDQVRMTPLVQMTDTFSKIVSLVCSHDQWLWLWTWMETFPSPDGHFPHLVRLHLRLKPDTSIKLDASKMPSDLVELSVSPEPCKHLSDIKLNVASIPDKLRSLSAEHCTVVASNVAIAFPRSLEHLAWKLPDTRQTDKAGATRKLVDDLSCSVYLQSVTLTSASEKGALLDGGAKLDLLGTHLTSLTLIVNRSNEQVTCLLNLPPTLTHLSAQLSPEQRSEQDKTHVWRFCTPSPLLHLKTLSIGFSYIRWVKPHDASKSADGVPVSQYGKKMTLAQVAPSLETLLLTQWPVVRSTSCEPRDASLYVDCETMTMLNRCMTLFTEIPKTVHSCAWRRGVDKYARLTNFTASFEHSIELATVKKLIIAQGGRLFES